MIRSVSHSPTCCRRVLTVLFIFSLMIVQRGTAQPNPQLVFDRANEHLGNGNYEEALAAYHTLEQRNQISGALFLNMGISYVQTNSPGKAKYYFIKASRFDETKSEAGEALEYVETRFSRQSAVLPKLPWERAVDWLRIHIGATSLLGISLLLLNLGVAILVATWFFIHRFGHIFKKAALGLAGAGIITLLLSFYVQYVDQRYSEAVMVRSKGNVLEQPSAEAPIVNQAYEGYTFTVDHRQSEAHPDWSYVRMSNGLYGWIANENICIL